LSNFILDNKSHIPIHPVLLSFGLSSIFFSIALSIWFTYDPTEEFKEFIPGIDGEPLDLNTQSTDADNVNIGEFFSKYAELSDTSYGSWPRFRGSMFTNINTEPISLRHSWAQKPPPLWSVDLGEGHAAPVIAHGRVYILDYDEENNADALRCFSLVDGKELWRRWYNVKIKRNHGMSRTIPAVADSFVVTIGPRCHVMCVNAISGELLWTLDLAKEYETEVPLWYTGQCPLVDDTVAVIAPGGSSLMLGINCRNGEIVWETPNPHSWKMSHSSIIPMIFFQKKFYVYCAVGGIVGVSAEGDDIGEVIFESGAFNQSVIAPSPVRISGNRIFVTAGYGAGSMMFKVSKEQNSFSLQPTQRINVKMGLASEQHTPVYFENHLFAVLPKDAGQYRNQFVCVHPDDCSKILWSSGMENRFGLGPYILADNKFYILNDNGELTVAEAGARNYKELGSVQLTKSIDAWGPIALTSGIFLMRDTDKMVCFDIRN
jgi:outer membrane protein assembly factor BamB